MLWHTCGMTTDGWQPMILNAGWKVRGTALPHLPSSNLLWLRACTWVNTKEHRNALWVHRALVAIWLAAGACSWAGSARWGASSAANNSWQATEQPSAGHFSGVGLTPILKAWRSPGRPKHPGSMCGSYGRALRGGEQQRTECRQVVDMNPSR